MSEGRIENLAALMAALFVVIKTGDLPQKMKLSENKWPYGLEAHVARKFGLSPGYVGNVASGRMRSAKVEKYLREEARTFVVRARPTLEKRVLDAVVLETGKSLSVIEKVTSGDWDSAPLRASLVRHGWPHPLVVKRWELPCTVEERRLLDQAALAKKIGVSKSAVSLVVTGRSDSKRVRAAIKEAVAAAKSEPPPFQVLTAQIAAELSVQPAFVREVLKGRKTSARVIAAVERAKSCFPQPIVGGTD